MSIRRTVLLLLKVTWVAVMVDGTAPGDEDDICVGLRTDGFAPTPRYSPTMRILMDSWNYQNLLSPRFGHVWTQVDNDNNNPLGQTTNVSASRQTVVWCINSLVRICLIE